MSWSKIPLALRIAIVANAALIAIALLGSSEKSFETLERMFLVRYGASFVIKGFAVYGGLELITLLAGRAALGARLAAAGWVVTLVISIVQVGLSLNHDWLESAIPTLQWVWWVAMLVIGGGLVLAAARRPLVAVCGGVLWLVTVARPPMLETWLWRQLWDHATLHTLLDVADLGLQGLAVGLLAAAAVGDVPEGFVIRDPQRVRWGLTKIASSLWLRLIAMAIVPVVTIATIGDRGHGLEAIGYTMIGAGFVNALAMLGFGLGALDAARANHPDLRKGAFYVAAAAMLWCGGVMLYQMPELYQRIFGDPDNYPYERARVIVEAFEYVLPVVALLAVAAWTVGVDGFATRRERLDLSERAQRTAVVFILLSFASFAVTRWLVPDARTDGSRVLVMLVAVIYDAVAMFNAARLAGDAAELGNVEQATLPTATML